MPKRILLIAGDFVDCLEVYTPWFSLNSMGIDVDIVCPNKKKGDKVTTAVHDTT